MTMTSTSTKPKEINSNEYLIDGDVFCVKGMPAELMLHVLDKTEADWQPLPLWLMQEDQESYSYYSNIRGAIINQMQF